MEWADSGKLSSRWILKPSIYPFKKNIFWASNLCCSLILQRSRWILFFSILFKIFSEYCHLLLYYQKTFWITFQLILLLFFLQEISLSIYYLALIVLMKSVIPSPINFPAITTPQGQILVYSSALVKNKARDTLVTIGAKEIKITAN